jgi:5-(hydroxymethyl)furfural/furfural oxidase
VRRRPNLKVLCNATVERVLFDSRSARGVAIRDSSGGRTLTGHAIYLSAGAIGSPALLLRSGIGEAEALRRLGIEPVTDLRGVGRGLQNHCIVNLAAWIAPSARQPDAMRTYALACARASSKLPLGRPGDLHLQFITRTSPNAHGDRLGIVGAALYAPLSRGSVTLRTPDPATPPDVAFNFLDHPADAERLAAVVGMALSLLDAPAVRALRGEVIAVTPSSLVRRLNRPDPRTRLAARLLAALLDAPAPFRRLVMQRAGTPLAHQDDLAANSAKQLLDYVQPVFHPAGTCAIGAADDPLAVLDPTCRVRGVEHLSVVDASVMPHIPTGNTCLPTMMVAEHAAELRRRRL